MSPTWQVAVGTVHASVRECNKSSTESQEVGTASAPRATDLCFEIGTSRFKAGQRESHFAEALGIFVACAAGQLGGDGNSAGRSA